MGIPPIEIITKDPVETKVEELDARIDELREKVQCQSRDLDVYSRTEKLIVAAGLLSEEELHAARVLVGTPSSKDYAVIT
ncbi:MAG: hypothetical protein COB36_10890 [Alphaproteobacteria bacterium]|nr:MAG: hypothetical protein COB36_10890 [Alphaproteobacteria bacterium]